MDTNRIDQRLEAYKALIPLMSELTFDEAVDQLAESLGDKNSWSKLSVDEREECKRSIHMEIKLVTRYWRLRMMKEHPEQITVPSSRFEAWVGLNQEGVKIILNEAIDRVSKEMCLKNNSDLVHYHKGLPTCAWQSVKDKIDLTREMIEIDWLPVVCELAAKRVEELIEELIGRP